MNPALNIVKEDAKLPDHYTLTITYHDKSTDEFKCVTHSYKPEMDMIEICKTDVTFEVIPLNAVRKISFDKEFTKLQELTAKKLKEKQNENDGQNPK